MSDENLPTEYEPEQIDRDNLGRFVKGVSGNPAGRPKGSKNRATVIREALQERSVRRVADDIEAILDKAVEMAKGGNEQMIKLFVKDLIHARDDDDEKGSSPSSIRINIKNLTVAPGNGAPPSAVIDGEFDHSEE